VMTCYARGEGKEVGLKDAKIGQGFRVLDRQRVREEGEAVREDK